jgi:hypothetical protein
MADNTEDINGPSPDSQAAQASFLSQIAQTAQAKQQHVVHIPAVEKSAVEKLAEIELAIKIQELENKKLEAEERKLNMRDIQKRLDLSKLKEEDHGQSARTKGQAIEQIKSGRRAHQSKCNHKKGGNGAQGLLNGQGDDSQYAIIKHTFPHGDTWVICLRCKKTWKPPVRSKFPPGDEGSALYLGKVAEYQAALNFQTRNSPSGSVMFKFSDNGEYMRKVMENTLSD